MISGIYIQGRNDTNFQGFVMKKQKTMRKCFQFYLYFDKPSAHWINTKMISLEMQFI